VSLGAKAAAATEPGELVVSTDARGGGSGGGLEAEAGGAGGADLVSGVSLWKLQIPSVQAPMNFQASSSKVECYVLRVASRDKSFSWRKGVSEFTKVAIVSEIPISFLWRRMGKRVATGKYGSKLGGIKPN
jgi:hypothetical protein